MSKNKTYFTSESVCAGHPDKIADAISDALLDEALRQDPESRAGIETVVGANQICLFGEIKTAAVINYEQIVRDCIKNLGYVNSEWGFSYKSNFQNYIHEQSPEIAIGVDKDGAGDQGMMFGYACDQTDQFLPLPIVLAHEFTKQIDEVRISQGSKWLRPDGKAQVTVVYKNGKPEGIEKLVIAVAHTEEITPFAIRQRVLNDIVAPILKKYKHLNPPTDDNIVVNGTGLWHIPGPSSDAGLTGRKIVVDGYGGYARVGGGAFSGKDPSKVDRSGAYAARYIAKNVVATGLATQCEVGLAYVIGKQKPLMQTIECFGTETKDIKTIEKFTHSLLDTSVKGIVEALDLKKPIFISTTNYGHFGKSNLPWERVAKS